ncbi:MAG: hypothetical protein H7289_11230 [Mucilaginibacter sp.]|nr:hypothetical protein [Mucilaginibacter sp.]
MRVEDPAALRFILQDDIYLLQGDKASIAQAPATSVADVSEPVFEKEGQMPSLAAPTLPPADTVTTTPPQPPTTAAAPGTISPALQITVTQTPDTQFNYMGGNKKQFLIITHYPTEDFIAADHLAALQNILKRKDYDIDDVAILNIAKATVTTVTDIVTYFKPEKLLILGEAAVPAGMGMPPVNQYKKMKNGVFLRSFSFDEMMSSTDNKKVFWEQMKNL